MFLNAKRASIIGIGNGIVFAEQVLFCCPPASRFSKAKRASVIGIGGRDGLCRTDFILSAARFKFLKSETCERDAGRWMDCI